MSKKKITGNEHLLKISLFCLALGAGLSYSLTIDGGYIISRAIFSIIFWFIGLVVLFFVRDDYSSRELSPNHLSK